MFAPLTRLLSALSRLAGAVEDLAGTCAEVNAGLRGRLQLEAPEPPALESEPAETNGAGRRKRAAPAG